jgi:hypothetical protein
MSSVTIINFLIFTDEALSPCVGKGVMVLSGEFLHERRRNGWQ